MYGKIFESIYEGSLYGQWEALITMHVLIVLADEHGVIDMTPPAISGKTSIPLEIIKKGIDILSAPDPYSRTPGSDGVRIELLDEHRPWGWFLVNHEKYRDLRTRSDRREYMKEYMRDRRKHKKLTDVNKQLTVNPPLTRLTNEDEDADEDADEPKDIARSASGFDEFWQQYPKKRAKKKALDIWKRKRLSVAAVDLVQDVLNRLTNDQRWTAGYIPDPCTYLNQERWQDELTDSRGKPMDSYSAQIDAAIRESGE